MAWRFLKPLLAKKLGNFDFVVNLPEAKSGPLLSFLAHTDFEDPSTFRDQIACLPSGLALHPENLAAYHDIARTFSCSADSSIFKSRARTGSDAPMNGLAY
jgi:hypothetical protein